MFNNLSSLKAFSYIESLVVYPIWLAYSATPSCNHDGILIYLELAALSKRICANSCIAVADVCLLSKTNTTPSEVNA